MCHAIFRDLVSAEFRPRFSKKKVPPNRRRSRPSRRLSHYSKIASLSCYVINETRDTYEKILWPLDRPIVQSGTLSRFGSPRFSARDAKLERRSRPTGAHEDDRLESHFRVVAVTPPSRHATRDLCGVAKTPGLSDDRSFASLPLTGPRRRARAAASSTSKPSPRLRPRSLTRGSDQPRRRASVRPQSSQRLSRARIQPHHPRSRRRDARAAASSGAHRFEPARRAIKSAARGACERARAGGCGDREAPRADPPSTPPTLVAYVRVGGPIVRGRASGRGSRSVVASRAPAASSPTATGGAAATTSRSTKLVKELNAGEITADVEVICAPPMVYRPRAEHPGPQVPARAPQNCWGGAGGAFHPRSRRGRCWWTPACSRVMPGTPARAGAVRRVRRVRGQEDQVRHRQGPFRDGVHRRDARRARGWAPRWTCAGGSCRRWRMRSPPTTGPRLSSRTNRCVGHRHGEGGDPEQAQEVHAGIRAFVANAVSPAVASAVRIQYGVRERGGTARSWRNRRTSTAFLVGGAAAASAPTSSPSATPRGSTRVNGDRRVV